MGPRGQSPEPDGAILNSDIVLGLSILPLMDPPLEWESSALLQVLISIDSHFLRCVPVDGLIRGWIPMHLVLHMSSLTQGFLLVGTLLSALYHGTLTCRHTKHKTHSFSLPKPPTVGLSLPNRSYITSPPPPPGTVLVFFFLLSFDQPLQSIF